MFRKPFLFGSVRFFAVFTLAALGSLLLINGWVTVVAAGGPAGSNPASKFGAAPYSCGGAWTTQAPAPVAISAEAATTLSGTLYIFGGVVNSSQTNAAYRYDPALDQWTTLAVMPQVLSGTSAVSDGTSAYIVGGDAGGNPVNTLYRYNPATNNYTTLANVPRIATRQAAVYLNGKIYRISGYGGNNTVDVYTIATNTWAGGPAYPLALENMAAMALGGYIYVAGGNDLNGNATNKTYRLEPSSGIWDDAAIADLPEARKETTGDVLNGRWIVTGGRNATGQVLGAVAWDPATNTWTDVPGIPTPVYSAAAGTASGSLYVVGGTASGSINTLQRYSEGLPCTATPTNTPIPTPTLPCGNVWATLTPYPGLVSDEAMTALNGALYSFGGTIGADTTAAYRYDPGPNQWATLAVLPQARSGASAVSDGTAIYILGGLRSGTLANTLWRYDPVPNTYTTLAAMPLSAAYQAAAYLNGKIYRIGGCTVAGCAGTSQVDVYTIATDTWASGPAYPAALYKGSAMALGGYIYVAGGIASGVTSNKTYRLDPSSGVWDDVSIADLPAARKEMAGDLFNGRWLLAGGRDGSGQLVGAIAWDPVGNTWATVAGMPTPAFSAGAATLSGGFYVVGGGAFSATNLTRRYSESVACTVTPTPTITPTNTPTNTRTATPTATITNTPTSTPTSMPTNTPTDTPTVTATPATALLVGHLTWQGRPAPPSVLDQQPLTLTLQLGATRVTYPNQQTDASGTFTVSVSTLPGGVYTWWVKGLTYLATSGTVSLSGVGVTQQTMGQQPAGDVNNDNLVDVSDFSLLRTTFGKQCGDGGYDGRADFTGDCLVDISDFSLLRSNFGQSGPPAP